MVKTISFHSYRGGSGKTTIASNLSALMTQRGYTVCLLDLDFNAPSLQEYFEKEPKKWINDFLYSNDAAIDDIMTDLSFVVHQENNYDRYDSKSSNLESFYLKQQQEEEKGEAVSSSSSYGRLLVGFLGTNKQVTTEKQDHKLEESVGSNNSKEQLLRNLILFRELLLSQYAPDYIILDTSYGMGFWPVNAMAIADISVVTLKMADIDIKGTKMIVNTCYPSFKKSGSKWFLLWNKVEDTVYLIIKL